jgi:uncharacterized cupredoxin-like copper-binding protein
VKGALAIGAVVLTLVSGAGLVAVSAAGSASEGEGVLVVPVTIRHSRFVPDRIEIPAGRPVRFVVENTDPIHHELIVGPKSVQDAHETGTHAIHGEVPGEVSVAAWSEATTTYRASTKGTLLMGCHLPGHWTYGMRGTVEVT